MNYGDDPKRVTKLDLRVDEMMLYQDMLIKDIGSHQPQLENRLQCFEPLIGAACCDFIADFGLKEYTDHYAYLTAKNLYQPAGLSINRPGWHTDGFGTPDITYIWCNAVATEFNSSQFSISEDENLSMIEMEAQADPKNTHTYNVREVLRLNRFNVHRPSMSGHATLRAFAKVIFSRDKFALLGNSINPMFEYDWEFKPRSNLRNVPQGNAIGASL